MSNPYEDAGSAYRLDAEGNPQELNPNEHRVDDSDDSDDDDDDDGPFVGSVSFRGATNAFGETVAVPSRSTYLDGSRTWRYSPAANPDDWPADYVDENLEQVMVLGWAVPNQQGDHWTYEQAVQAHATYVQESTEAYRATWEPEDGYGAEVYDAYQAPVTGSADAEAAGAPASPVPPAPPSPAGAQAANTDDRQEPATYDDVMSELRRTVPPNEGRWSASQAAQAYGDQDYFQQPGIRAAQDAADNAPVSDAEGRISAEDYLAQIQAGADVDQAYLDAERADTRYNQTTDRDTTALDLQQEMLDRGVARTRDQVAQDPGALGIGLSFEEQEYQQRSGQQVQPGAGLTEEQRQWLDLVREQERVQHEQSQAEFAASPEGQQAAAQMQAASDAADAREARFQQSRQAYDERTGNR